MKQDRGKVSKTKRDKRDLILAELKRLESTGKLTPNNVVDTARDPANPMHDWFEWNNDKAAENWRTYQARQLISSFTVQREMNETTYDVQQFVEDPRKPENEQGYVAFARIESDEDMQRRMMDRELDLAGSYVNRARQFAGALGLLPEVESMQRELYELRKRVQAGLGGPIAQ